MSLLFSYCFLPYKRHFSKLLYILTIVSIFNKINFQTNPYNLASCGLLWFWVACGSTWVLSPAMQANRILPSPYFWGVSRLHIGIFSLFVKPFSAWGTFCPGEIGNKPWASKVYWASPPRYYPVSKIVTDRDLGSKRNQDGGFFLFHCDMAFTRLVLAGENLVSTSKGSLTYILTPGLIFLVFPSDTFVSWWCGTRLREPRAHVLVSTKFNACSYLRNHISTVAC